MATRGRALRRGLPRVLGGAPWPPADENAVAVASEGVSCLVAEAPAAAADLSQHLAWSPADRKAQPGTSTGRMTLRRGLTRVPGGEPWPPASAVAYRVATPPLEQIAEHTAEPVFHEGPAQGTEAVASVPPSFVRPETPAVSRQPLQPVRETPEHHAATRPAPEGEPAGIASPARGKQFGRIFGGVLGVLAVAALVVVGVRWLLSTEPLQDFLVAFPGEYNLPDGAPLGFPGWLGWQHFFNVFLMVLIIRSGLRVRAEKSPKAFWAPRNNPQAKISLMGWLHQSLDILWLVNGTAFVVLLFVSGQWMRVIPTSMEVFPNAVSAALQYVSLDWPTENGWVNYNSLQQLAYFTTVFVAAPLAAITGYRMSVMWPKNAKALNKAYPIEAARTAHFPVMLYFVVFIFIHVALVLLTGALRNLNHMYAAQGSADGIAYANNWTGFWMFAASLLVIAVGWVAARPLMLLPIAKRFGNVSSR